MRIHRTPIRKSSVALAALMALGVSPAEQAVAASCTWNPATGNWAVAANWSCGVVPTGGPDTAIVAAGKAVTVDTAQSTLNLTNAGSVNINAFLLSLTGGGSTTNTGTINVGAGAIPNNAALQVASGHNITNTGGVINISADSVLNQFGSTITGGTINTTGSGRLVGFASNSNVLSGVTLNGTLDLASGNGIERITNGLTLGGAAGLINVNSNSVLSFIGDQTLGGTGTVVLGNTGSSNRALSMEGNTALTIGSGVVVRGENGTLGQAYLVGGTQSLINNGRISADVSGGTLRLAPSGGTTNNGILEARNGGTLFLDSAVTGAVGSSIFAGAGSAVWQNGVTLSGVINADGAGSFRAVGSNANVLNGVTFNGPLDLGTSFSIERVTGGLTLNGSIAVNSNSVLSFIGNQTLGGTGTIAIGDTGSSNRALSMEGDTVLTIGPNIVVRGQNGTIGQAYTVGGAQSIVNNGLISADVAGGTLHLTPSGGTTNNGILEARNGGTLFLDSAVTGAVGSSIFAGAGSAVWQNGVTLSGVINADGAGSFRAVGSNANVLNGVTFNGPLDLGTSFSIERVTGGLTLNGSIAVNSNSVLSFIGNQTLGGTGTIAIGDTGSSNRALSMEGDTALTIGQNIVVRGQNGTIGQAYTVGGAQTIINNGLISADVAGGTLHLTPSGGTTNNGILEAKNGGTLNLDSNVTGSPGGSIIAGAGSTVLQNGVTLSGVINTAGTGLFRATASNANVLNGVTFNGPLDLATGNSVERVTGGLTLNGSIAVNSNSVLSFIGDQTLGGNGSIVLGDTGSSNRALNMEGDMTLTVGPNIVVSGKNGTVGSAYLAGGTQVLANNGIIRADVAGGLIDLSAALTNNAGTLGASNGGTLRMNNAVTQIGGGQILANDASTVIQSGMTITGGTIAATGSGRMAVTASNANFLSGVTLTGLIDLASSNGVERVVNGLTLNGGAINLNSNSVLSFVGDQTLGGTGSIVLGNSGSSNRALSMEGNMTLTVGPNIVVHGVNGTLGQAYLAGGAQNLVNNGTINSDGGGLITIANTGALTNNGTLRAQNGTLALQSTVSGTGTLQVDGTGAMTLTNGGNTQGRLAMGAAGASLNVGTGNLVINTDYTNVAAGTGNSFNRRAGITGTGQVVAGGNAAQAITGTNVSNGNTANATLTINNVRVGATTYNYQVANTGSTGPSLRGAIQTNVNSANLSDARLSGAGVTAGNFNTGAPGGNTGNLGVTFTAASAGALTPLTGQVLNLTSNFSNIADQKLNIVLAGGAAAYNTAVGNAASPVQVANQRIGGSSTATLAVTNTAAAGAFSEDLNVSLGATSAGISGSGSIAGRLAGASSGGGNITVGVDTTSSGAKSGTATLNYQTAGTVGGVSNGLGTASVGNQLVTVNGNVYQAATGAIQSAPLNFGTVQVGQSVSQNLVIRNTATGANGFVEDLNASFGSTSGTGAGLISGVGSLNGILAGTNSTAGNGSMTVSVNTAAAGTVAGNIAVNYVTAGKVNGASNGLGTAPAGSENYGVAGTIQAVANVINQASPLVNNPSINLGAVRVGAASPTANVSVTNVATVAPQAALNASILSNGAPITASGSFNLLNPGSTSTNQLQVGLNTAVAGNYTGANAGSATIAFVSDADNVGGCAPNCQLNLASQNVSVSGKVYTQAVGQLATPTVDFGIVRVGDAVASRNITVQNTAAVTGLNDTLRANLSGVGGAFTSGSTVGGVAAQSAGNISVSLSTASAGNFTQNGAVGFLSQNPDMADVSAGANAGVQVHAQVNNIADAVFELLGSLGAISKLGAEDYVLDLGNLAISGAEYTLAVKLKNQVSGPADDLSGLFTLTDGNDFDFSGWGAAVNGLGAGQSTGNLGIGLMALATGQVQDIIDFNGFSTNGSGPDLAEHRRLFIRANVVDSGGGSVPEPGTLALLVMAALAGWLARRQRGNTSVH